MQDLLNIVVTGGAVTGLATLLALGTRYREQQLAAAWKQTATILGGQFTPKGGSFWNRTPMHIVVALGQTVLTVDHYTVNSGRSSATYTRITAKSSGPPGFRLKLSAQGMFSVIGELLGVQDIRVGDKAFDDAFVIKANDEGLAHLWLSPCLREEALRARDYQISMTGAWLESIYSGLEDNSVRLTRAVRTAALFANRGRELGEEWEKLARELGGTISHHAAALRPDDPAPIELEHNAILVSIDLCRVEASHRVIGSERGFPGVYEVAGRFGTRVRANRVASSAERFTIERRAQTAGEGADLFGDQAFAAAYNLKTTASDRVARRFTDELRREILTLKPEKIAGDEVEITLVLGGVHLRRNVLDSAVAIVSSLATPLAEGPYR